MNRSTTTIRAAALSALVIVILGLPAWAGGGPVGHQAPGFVMERVSEFFAFNTGTNEFAKKSVLHVQPIYAYGIDGIAYYEVWLSDDGSSPRGWLMLSATEMDYPLVNFSHEGTPYSLKAFNAARDNGQVVERNARIYRFGVSYFTVENGMGQLIGEYGEMPTWLPRDVEASGSGAGNSIDGVLFAEGPAGQAVEGVDYDAVRSYDDLKVLFPASYFTARRAAAALDMASRIFPDKGHGEAYGSNGYMYRYIYNSSNQCLYTQIPANYRYNWTSCWSGCNNNAWMNLYGWWDKNMSKGSLVPTTSTGETCPTYRNTNARQDVVDPGQMWLRSTCGTYCNDGGGWTYWSKAYLGYKYTTSKGYGYHYWYQWCNSAGCDVDLADIVIECANLDRPSHIGANSHFYFVYGVAQWDTNTDWTWVYCYPGWQQNHDDDVWIWWHDLNSATEVLVY